MVSGVARSGTSTTSETSDSRSSASFTTRPYTGRSRPKTAATSSGFSDNEIICAFSEGRGVSPTVGLSFVNLTTCEAVLCQFADTQTYARTCHKIGVFDLSEILFADTAAESKLLSVLKENLEVDRNGIDMTRVPRRYWDENAGHDGLRRLALSDDYESVKHCLGTKFFAMCCFAAVLQYIDLQLGKTFAPQALRIKLEASEGAMMIDGSTVSSLELVQNTRNIKSRDCLYGLLNETLTKTGARTLKSNILQPSTDRSKTLQRHKAAAELSRKDTAFVAVREALTDFVDTDKVLAAVTSHRGGQCRANGIFQLVVINKKRDFTYVEQSVNNVLMLKSFVDSISQIFEALSSCESEELQAIRQLCGQENYIEVQRLIVYALNEDVGYSSKASELRNQRVYAIRAGVNGFLDVARKTYKEISQDIEDAVDELREQCQINLQLKFDPARQFYLVLKAAELEDRQLPEVFVNVFRQKGVIQCQTLELMKTNQRLKDAHDEVITISDGSVQKLIDATRSQMQPLFRISEAIAMLDMLASFAHVVTTQNYVEPEMLETVAVKAARHPVREKIQQDKFIPNDVFATEQSRFQIITGCNMSGKSTYIRSIALMIVVAQIGCFVSAEYASFPIVHQLFARVSTDDSIEANVSTFTSEMREMSYILRNIEPCSLVIVDELGRGTSTTDGLAIAIAISEALIESKAFVWFVTHFRDLPRILAERAGVVNLHLAVDISPNLSSMKMRYKIAEGCEEQKFYGLALAKLVDLPKQVNDCAAEVSQYLHERNESRKSNVKALAVAKRRKLMLQLKEQLEQARNSNADNETLVRFLRKLQEEFLIRMSVIDAEANAPEVGGCTPSTYHTRVSAKRADSIQTSAQSSPAASEP